MSRGADLFVSNRDCCMLCLVLGHATPYFGRAASKITSLSLSFKLEVPTLDLSLWLQPFASALLGAAVQAWPDCLA